MKTKLFLLVFSFISLFGFISPSAALADTFSITGIATNNGVTPLENIDILLYDSSTDTLLDSQMTNSNGEYNFSVEEGTYDVVANPNPAEFQYNAYADQVITENTELNFALEETVYYTVDGYITDKTDTAVSGISINIASETRVTDENGYYSFSIPYYMGSIFPRLTSNGNSSPNLPQTFTISTYNSIGINEDTQLNIQIPSIVATVAVTDGLSNPVEGATALLYTSHTYDEDKTFIAPSSKGDIIYTIESGTIMGQNMTDSNGNVAFVTFPVGLKTEVTSPNETLLSSMSEPQKYTIDSSIPVTLYNAPISYDVSGTITDKNGIGISGMSVKFTDEEGSNTTYTNSAGYYYVSHLRGHVSLTLQDGYSPNLPAGIDIRAQRQIDGQSGINITDNTELNIQLPSELVTINVKDEAETPIENATVYIYRNYNTDPDQFFTAQSNNGDLEFYNTKEYLNQGVTNALGVVSLYTFPINTKIYVPSPLETLAEALVDPYYITEDSELPITLYNIPQE